MSKFWKHATRLGSLRAAWLATFPIIDVHPITLANNGLQRADLGANDTVVFKDVYETFVFGEPTFRTERLNFTHTHHRRL